MGCRKRAAWKRATGLDIYEGYGQTESVVMVANVRSHGDVIRPGSMGRPLPGFDLAVLDVLIPEISGDAVAERLLQLHPGLRVVLMTGNGGSFMKFTQAISKMNAAIAEKM